MSRPVAALLFLVRVMLEAGELGKSDDYSNRLLVEIGPMLEIRLVFEVGAMLEVGLAFQVGRNNVVDIGRLEDERRSSSLSWACGFMGDDRIESVWLCFTSDFQA